MLTCCRLRILTVVLGLLLLSIFFIGCGEKGDQPIARVGGRIISIKEFEDNFSRGKAKNILVKSTLEDKIAHLNKMIDKELQIVAAYQKGLDRDEEVIKRLETRGETTILKRLVDKVIVDANIPESEIKKYYKKSKKQVKISEILLNASAQPSEQEQKAIDNKIKLIKSEIKKGADFAELVVKYSQDKSKSSPERGQKGLLSWTSMTALDPITQKAFSLKVGEISEPIKTNKGYSIIKVTEIIDVDVKPFEDEKERIKQEILRMRGKELEEKYFKYLDDLKAQYNAKFQEANIEKFIQIINEPASDTSQTPKMMDSKEMFSKFNDEHKGLSLISYDGGKITIGKLIDDLSQFPVTRMPNIKEAKVLHDLLDRRMLPRELLNLEAKAKNIKNDKQVREQLKFFRESYMLDRIRKMEINDQLNVTDDDLKKYYEEHRDEFKNPEEREVQEISVKDAKLSEKIAALAKAGENFTRLAQKYNENAATKKNNGNLGFIRKARQYIGGPAFELKIGEVEGPIKAGNKFSIIKLLSIKPESYKTFEESQNTVKSKVNRIFMENKEKQWLDELRKGIEITIYENKLKNTFADLSAES